MRARSWELITADESTILAKSGSDPIVVEDGESDRCFPNPSCANKSDGFEILGKPYNLLDQPLASKTVPRCWGRQFARRNTMKM